MVHFIETNIFDTFELDSGAGGGRRQTDEDEESDSNTSFNNNNPKGKQKVATHIVVDVTRQRLNVTGQLT